MLPQMEQLEERDVPSSLSAVLYANGAVDLRTAVNVPGLTTDLASPLMQVIALPPVLNQNGTISIDLDALATGTNMGLGFQVQWSGLALIGINNVQETGLAGIQAGGRDTNTGAELVNVVTAAWFDINQGWQPGNSLNSMNRLFNLNFAVTGPNPTLSLNLTSAPAGWTVNLSPLMLLTSLTPVLNGDSGAINIGSDALKTGSNLGLGFQVRWSGLAFLGTSDAQQTGLIGIGGSNGIAGGALPSVLAASSSEIKQGWQPVKPLDSMNRLFDLNFAVARPDPTLSLNLMSAPTGLIANLDQIFALRA